MLYPSELRALRSQLYAQTQGGYNIRCSTHATKFAVTKTEEGGQLYSGCKKIGVKHVATNEQK